MKQCKIFYVLLIFFTAISPSNHEPISFFKKISTTIQSHKGLSFLISAAFVISMYYAVKNYGGTKSKVEKKQNKITEEQKKNDRERRIDRNNYEYDVDYWKELKPRLKISEDEVLAFENYTYNEEKVFKCAYAKNVKFFYGNCDKDNEKGAEEIGFGCAWRSLQTLLSPHFIFYSFSILYKEYKLGDKSKTWEQEQECAEPGYAKEICEDFGIEYRLYRYNREGTDKTPIDQCTSIKDFSGLVLMLINHFEKYKTPIMIDDVKHACVILGIKITENNNVILWMADPYADTKEKGLYYLILSETGEVIAREGQKTKLPDMDPQKGWLLLSLQEIESEIKNNAEKIDLSDLFESKNGRDLFARDGKLPKKYGDHDFNKLLLLQNFAISENDARNFIEYRRTNQEIDAKNIIHYAKNIYFFHGLCDSYEKTLGWACAWRDIQTILSFYNIFYSLENLYNAYRTTEKEQEWAEPGYGFKILYDHKIKSKLYRYNDPTISDTTKTNWCTPLTGFPVLVSMLMKHFEKYKTPVMIDDVSYAYTILGIKKIKKEKDNEVVFWIADPHKKSLNYGLYYLMLDEKTGKKIECTGIDDDDNGLNSSQRIDFENKGWLILCPQKKLE